MDDIFKATNSTTSSRKKSIDWYRTRVREVTGAAPTINPKSTSQIIPGHMYMFFYDPKYKEVLPYYDQFPLVLPFSRDSTGFKGINLHYLPYMARAKLLGTLHKHAIKSSIPENVRVRISWEILNGFSNAVPFKDGVKHYLNSHVRSRLMRINYSEWITASQLPLEMFTTGNKQKAATSDPVSHIRNQLRKI